VVSSSNSKERPITAAACATSREAGSSAAARARTASASVSGTGTDAIPPRSGRMAASSSSACSGMPSLRSWMAATMLAGAARPSTAPVMAAVWAMVSRGRRISSASRWVSSRARSSRIGTLG
jgi:hypothetical protein